MGGTTAPRNVSIDNTHALIYHFIISSKVCHANREAFQQLANSEGGGRVGLQSQGL